MKYMLLMYADESKVPQTLEAQQAAAPVWSALAEQMKAAGVWLSSSGLSPIANATTLRVREGKTLITDGPFAETHEQLGSYFLLECNEAEDALQDALINALERWEIDDVPRNPGARLLTVAKRRAIDRLRRALIFSSGWMR